MTNSITYENAREYLGRKVRVEYGAMHGGADGEVVAIRTTRFGTDLELETVTDGGARVTHHCSQFSDIGVGTRLLPL